MSRVEIKILVDNEPPSSPGLRSAWGFSALVKSGDVEILFDTGPNSDVLLKNAKALGVSFENIEAVVISHAHLDHVGGLPAVLKVVDVPVYVPEPIRIPGRVVVTTDWTEVAPGFWVSGSFGTTIKEQFLVVKEGPVMLVGCSHPGIARLVDVARSKFGKLKYLVGGFHMASFSPSEAEDVARRVSEAVEFVSPTHCTGKLAKEIFQKIFGKKYVPIRAGSVLVIEKEVCLLSQ